MTRFLPPPFNLWEFDNSGPLVKAAERRWLSHWDGLVGSPAEEVSLGWSAGAAVALICTSGRSYDHTEARFRAAHLALGGDELPLAHRPPDATATMREISRISSADELWRRGASAAAGMPALTVALCDGGFTVAYFPLADGYVFIAAVRLAAGHLRVREVADWRGQ